MQPRLIRLRDAPNYLGMDKNRFNKEVKPCLSIIPIGKRGIVFDRLDLDAWVEHYKKCNDRPANKRSKKLWGEKERQVYSTVRGSGTYIDSREKDGVKKTTINQGLEIVRRILNRATGDWVDENGVTWLANAPKIKLLVETNKRYPFPLNWNEQNRLFAELPLHLRRMALFAVNTGCRDKEICRLQWNWEVKIPELNTSVFIIPGEKVKNR